MKNWFSSKTAPPDGDTLLNTNSDEPPSAHEGWFSSLKRKVGLENAAPPTVLAQADQAIGNCFGLSWENRMVGFGVSVAIGVACFALGILFLFSPIAFGVLATLGFLALLISTFFLVGPWQQIKNMAQPMRLVSSLVFVGSMVLTLLSALYINSVLLTLLCIVIEIGAFVYYAASYVPYGQACLQNTCRGCVQGVQTGV